MKMYQKYSYNFLKSPGKITEWIQFEHRSQGMTQK